MSDMKPWQYGHDIELLKTYAKKYDNRYNTFAYSPFAKVKKNNIAESLHKNTLKILDVSTMIEVSQSKTTSRITMHGDTVIGTKQKGDITFSKLIGNVVKLEDYINTFDEDCWLYVWAEDEYMRKLAHNCGFSWVGIKISTFSELTGIYYRGTVRPRPAVDPAEYLSIKQLPEMTSRSKELIDIIANKLTILPQFTNHYSNYNKDKSWSAIALRGYLPDSSFITKPSEMNDKWKEANAQMTFQLQDTDLFGQFPEVRELLVPYGSNLHRVRFMRLEPGGGELERHTDQVDSDSGGSLGKLARLHFPIRTNPEVKFQVWGTDECATVNVINMKKGEAWFLDTRKPHTACNFGTESRIHLVVDIETEKVLHDRLIG